MPRALVFSGFVLLLIGSARPSVVDGRAGESEKEAVAAIEKLGGTIVRSSGKPDGPVTGVLFRQCKLKGEDLKHLAALKNLQYLVFFTVKVEGDGLRNLKGLKELHTLSLGFTRLSAKKTWEDLRALQQLKQIGIGYTEIDGQREPAARIRELLPKAKIIGPLLLVPTEEAKGSSGAAAAADWERASVEGTVTLNDQPLAGARVIFYLKDDQLIGAKTQKDGSFRVKGVPVGTHKVTVEVLREGRSLLPPKYASEATSELRVEVKKGANTHDFKLRSR
jgi:hypothetical protein